MGDSIRTILKKIMTWLDLKFYMNTVGLGLDYWEPVPADVKSELLDIYYFKITIFSNELKNQPIQLCNHCVNHNVYKAPILTQLPGIHNELCHRV